MVSRNRYGRYDVEARDADAPSPWSDDQATTSYFAGHLRAVPGGVPPLPERFAEAEQASDAGFDDEPTQWHDDLVSWDETPPPRASGVARVQPTAADHPRPGMAAYATDPEETQDWAAELDAQLQAATRPDALASERARWAHAGPANGAHPQSARAYAQAPLELEPVTQAHAQDPYAWEPTTAYVPAELEEENPWEDEPNLHEGELSQLYAADPGAWEVAPAAHAPQPTASAARTQRQLPQRMEAPTPSSRSHALPEPVPPRQRQQAASPHGQAASVPAARTQRQRAVQLQSARVPGAEMQPRSAAPASSPRLRAAESVSARLQTAAAASPRSAAATGPRRAVTSRPELAQPARQVQDTRALSRSAQPTQRHRPAALNVAAPDAALDDNPFAKPRSPHGSWLLSAVVSCGAVAALYFSGSVDRLSSLLHGDQAPVLRSAAAPSAAPVVPPPPVAAEPSPPEPEAVAVAEPVREPAGHARGGSWRKRGSADDDMGASTKKRAPDMDDLSAADEPARKPSSRRSAADADLAAQATDPENLGTREPSAEPAHGQGQPATPDAQVTLRINSRPWSQVFIDGKLVGNTPQLALRVSAGHHDVRLANPELEVSKTFQLDARPGETVSRVELLTD